MEKNINQLIAKVLNNEASSEEIICFSRWLSESEENNDEFRKLKSYWDADTSFFHNIKPELSLESTQLKIYQARKKRRTKQVMILGLSIVASLLILFGIDYFILKVNKATPVEYYTYITDNNRIDFILEDGTKICLNKNSKFTYTDTYNKTNRNVKLDGEAYFNVAYNPENPFIIEFKDVRIRVLGTTFNVKHDEHANIMTTLAEGSLRFEAPDQQVTLTPDQQLLYTTSSRRIDITSVDVEKELAWVEGVIRVKHVLFSDIINDLKEKYQVHIVIQNENLKNSSVSMSGTFAEDQSLEDIFKVISISYPFKWEKRDGAYYINNL